MSELTQNTINFCKHHAPFKGESTAGGGQVRDSHGLTLARCERIDDAWTIAEALNAVGQSGRAANPEAWEHQRPASSPPKTA